jgi:hypothetical protein
MAINIEHTPDQMRVLINKLVDYCQTRDWAGYDPYDALNSKILEHFPLLNTRIPRLAFTQLSKRIPINLRPLFRVPKTQNPKAIALFLKSLIQLKGIGLLRDQGSIKTMVEKLEALRAEGNPYYCWGYSFPWQTKELLVPRGAPNIVCTVFVASALLDVYEDCHDQKCLLMAKSAAQYIANDLYWTNGDISAGFGYPFPSTRIHIYNANFLGSALLYRVSHHTGDKSLLIPAVKVARYSASKQNADGSWFYGELSRQKWIDNFHTGYNLMALADIAKYGATTEFDECIQRGLDFYKAHFFREDGAPKYFHDSVYPVDIHSVAQSIITLVTFSDFAKDNIQLAHSVLAWALANMWNARGYFYFQKHRYYKVRISYMRWSQAWMLLALTSLLDGPEERRESPP